MVSTGLDRLVSEENLQKQFPGKVALLAHNASLDQGGCPAAMRFKEIFRHRFIKLFGPQHGYATADQDNMIETGHYRHPYFGIPVFSLYSETRVPTDEMLNDVDHLFVDLQDIGSRMYTYVYTLTLLLEKCQSRDIEVIVLDRPNPINGQEVEGNILQPGFASFIGRHPLPVRHGLTIGEIALMHQKYWTTDRADLKVISMQGWQRFMYFQDTGLPWALPSPNISRPESALIFPATVYYEGTNLSEGRGTTQPFEIIGHPSFEPFKAYEQHFASAVKSTGLSGFILRPLIFQPTYHKHQDWPCGGFQIHVTDKKSFQPWRTGQFLLREIYRYLGPDFEWLEPPYEYVYDRMPIDIINGSDRLRQWVEQDGSMKELEEMEDLDAFMTMRKEVLLY